MVSARRTLPRVLTATLAREHGLSRAAVRHAVASRGWRPLARGVVLTRDEVPTRDDWADVGLLLSGPGSAISGWDAVRLHGLGDRVPPSDTVLVLDRIGRNRRFGQVRIRPTTRPFTTSVLPAEHPTLPYAAYVGAARAVADTALQYSSLAPVRALVTSAVQRRRCTPQQLLDEYEHCPRGGSRWLRRSLGDLAVNAKSIAEAEAVDWLTRAAVPSFELNVPVIDVHGRVVAELDVYWRALRAVAEIDGREFHFSEQDWTRTLLRHNRLTRLSLAVAHHTPGEVRQGRRRWADGVAAWLRRRSRELGVPAAAGNGPVPIAADGPRPVLLDAAETRLWSR